MTLWQKYYELERTQVLTVLTFAMQKTTKLAGYMSAGNRFVFLDIDGSVACLYHFPKFLSYPRVVDKCYDRILSCLNGLLIL